MKIHQLHNLIDWLNKNHNTNIVKLPLKKSPLSEDSWLSGFIDSDGSFSVQHTKLENGAKKRKISCRLRIEQRMFDPITNESYLHILTDIANFFNCSLLTRTQKSTGNQYYTLTASSRKSLNIILNYVNKYPLYSSKYLDYKDWEKIVLLILDNKHSGFSDEAIAYAALKKSQMNTKRTEFNWDHLDLLSSSPNNTLGKYPNALFKSINTSTGNSTLKRPLINEPNYFYINIVGGLSNNRKYSTVDTSSLSAAVSPKNNPKLDNFYVAGFCDADASFTVSVLRKSNMKIGWSVLARLNITLHKKDVGLLYSIQSCLGGVGTITIRNNSDVADFVVGSVGDLVNKVIPFFLKYPLITHKRADFIIFCKIVELINQKEHLTLEGIQKIVNLKASMNKGLTDKLKQAFPDTKPIPRPVIDKSLRVINPWWLAGFIDGEGSFTVSLRESSRYIRRIPSKFNFSS